MLTCSLTFAPPSAPHIWGRLHFALDLLVSLKFISRLKIISTRISKMKTQSGRAQLLLPVQLPSRQYTAASEATASDCTKQIESNDLG